MMSEERLIQVDSIVVFTGDGEYTHVMAIDTVVKAKKLESNLHGWSTAVLLVLCAVWEIAVPAESLLTVFFVFLIAWSLSWFVIHRFVIGRLRKDVDLALFRVVAASRDRSTQPHPAQPETRPFHWKASRRHP